MRVIVDSREQAPFPFRGPRYEGVTVEVGGLTVGDYSLAGLTDRVAVERKSLPDLVMCLGRERERFERELARGAALDAFCVVVEASWADLAGGQYRSRMNPHAALPERGGIHGALPPALPLCRKPPRRRILHMVFPPAISGGGPEALGRHREGA